MCAGDLKIARDFKKDDWVCVFVCVVVKSISLSVWRVCLVCLVCRCVCVFVCIIRNSSSQSLRSNTTQRRNTQQHTATHRTILQHTQELVESSTSSAATHCNTLQRTATHCNTLLHTATHCNTLQHTASHCIILMASITSSAATH